MIAQEEDFAWDVTPCAICGEPAAYRLWRGERLLACHCDRHHNEWWNNHDLALHEIGELVATTEKETLR